MNAAMVQKALARWPLVRATVTATAERENIVHRIESDTGCFALRLHRSGYHDKDALQSEMMWMAALAERDIKVPAPLASRSGHFVEEIDGVHVDVLSWLPGKPMGSAQARLDVVNRAGTLFQLGAALAQLHRASDAWSLPAHFKRHAWNLDGLLGDTPFWGRFWDNPHLSENEGKMLRAARQAARVLLAQIDGVLDFGLIHADAVRENVLLHGDDVYLIDFDDGGFGYRLFDLATVLLKCRSEPDIDDLTTHLIAGYRSVRAIDCQHLDLMLALRAFTYVGWIVPRLSEAWAPQRLQRFKEDAVHHAKVLLGTALR
jgi:Ser/Thr protein kinase RdoA (MazF antagonist)